eukprot:158770-Rhodomonas_salina.1
MSDFVVMRINFVGLRGDFVGLRSGFVGLRSDFAGMGAQGKEEEAQQDASFWQSLALPVSPLPSLSFSV